MSLPQFPSFVPSSPTPIVAPSARSWSEYQEAVFASFLTGKGNVVIEAVAGSGKTTTMIEGIRRWVGQNRGKRVIFVAFSKVIASELERRVPAGVEAKTLHSACFGSIKRRFGNVQLDNYKIDDTTKVLMQEKGVRQDCRGKVAADLKRAYGMVKSTMTDIKDIDACAETLAAYEIALDMPTIALPLLADLDVAMRANTTRITFDEMLSFIIDHDIQPFTYDLVCVDEVQDMNLMQIAILRKMVKTGGRFFAVGDKFQAIFAFRGADTQAMARIRSDFNVPAENELPLSITYRCPRSVVAMAQQYVSHIRPAPNAAEGEVIHCGDSQGSFDATMRGMKPGDMGICRANAPLIQCALALISEGRKAKIKGRDIGASIVKLMRTLIEKNDVHSISDLAAAVADHQTFQVEKLRKARKDAQANSVEDRCETLMAILNGADSLEEIDVRIERLFSDADESGAVVFSSVHRAKGLESDTVVWIGPEISEWILRKVKTQEGRNCENNLSYVAITRAIKKLVIQPLPARGKED